jgi:hypothetical protein
MDGSLAAHGDRMYRGTMWVLNPCAPGWIPGWIPQPVDLAAPSNSTPAPFQVPLLLPPSQIGPNSNVPAPTSLQILCAVCGTLGSHRCVFESKGALFLHFVCRNNLDHRRDITVMNAARVLAEKPLIRAPSAPSYKCEACRKALGAASARLVALPAAERCSPMKKPLVGRRRIQKRSLSADVASAGERLQSRRVSETFREDLWSFSREASDLEANSALDKLNDLRAGELRDAAAAETLRTEAAARLVGVAVASKTPRTEAAARLVGVAVAVASSFAFADDAEVWYSPLTGPGFP